MAVRQSGHPAIRASGNPASGSPGVRRKSENKRALKRRLQPSDIGVGRQLFPSLLLLFPLLLVLLLLLLCDIDAAA